MISKQHIILYEGETHTGNDSERNQHKGDTLITRKPTRMDHRAQKGKKCFVAVLVDITRRGALPAEAFIHTAEMTAIKIAMTEIQKRER